MSSINTHYRNNISSTKFIESINESRPINTHYRNNTSSTKFVESINELPLTLIIEIILVVLGL